MAVWYVSRGSLLHGIREWHHYAPRLKGDASVRTPVRCHLAEDTHVGRFASRPKKLLALSFEVIAGAPMPHPATIEG